MCSDVQVKLKNGGLRQAGRLTNATAITGANLVIGQHLRVSHVPSTRDMNGGLFGKAMEDAHGSSWPSACMERSAADLSLQSWWRSLVTITRYLRCPIYAPFSYPPFFLFNIQS